VLSSLDKFDSLSVLNLAIVYLELSRALQGKDTTLPEAIIAANLAKNHYTRLRTKAEFNKLYESCVSLREGKSGKPVLPRYRRAPARLDRFERPEDYYRVQYYEATAKKNAIRKPIRTSQVKASR